MTSHSAISIGLRTLQLACTLINFGVSVAVSVKAPVVPSKVAGVVAVSSVSLVHLATVLIPPLLWYIPNMAVIGIEFVLLAVWILAFVYMTQEFVTFGGCSAFPDAPKTLMPSLCSMGRTLTAFTFFSWFIAVFTVGLVVTYTVIPVSMRVGFGYLVCNQGNDFTLGALYSSVKIPLASDPESQSDDSEDEKKTREGSEEAEGGEEGAAGEAKEEATEEAVGGEEEPGEGEQDGQEQENDNEEVVKVPGHFGDTDSLLSKYYVVKVKCSPMEK